MAASIWPWVGFNLFVLVMLAIDLGLVNRKAHAISVREAGIWSVVVISTALIFNFGLYRVRGTDAGLEFLTGYLIELALSVDNLFVFLLIFSYFRVPAKYQHRVLFWGILGALIMRGVMIGAGAVLIERFHWIIYVFGAFLVFTGIRMAKQDEMQIEPEANPVLRLVRRFLPITPSYEGQKFFTQILAMDERKTRRAATPLLVVLVMVETTDLIFALDSIPAIFGVTSDPFIVYTSNVFAVMGLRSLYFVLAGVIDRFHYLQIGLSIVLVWIGVKMLLTDVIHIPTQLSLGVVALVLAGAVIASLMFPRKAREESPVVHDPLNPSETLDDEPATRGSEGPGAD